jgi:arylsulfatase A-like enzyme
MMSRFAPLLLLLLAAAARDRQPNVLLIITDDQGYGDLGCHGNPEIRTPKLDAFAKESVRFSQFHVCPVCSPTRSSLLTGRYNYRTGVVDTYAGRSMMHADEVTLAEYLAGAGYKTGIFGKWHLGDSYPLRAMDQGFQEALTIKGGGLGQDSDPPGGDHYHDPTLYRNGRPFKSKGYCTDLFTDAAIEFMTAHQGEPFFAYVPFNAPHTPLEAPESYLKPYLDAGLKDPTASVYAMETNIDDNVGRMLQKLKELGLERDTIVVFMSDNGPQQQRYNAEMRGLKGSVFQGGIRVPFYMRWTGVLEAGREIAAPAAHIDVTPTLLEACGARRHKEPLLDGVSFWPHLKGGPPPGERNLFWQWHRGDVPEKHRACAVRKGRWKLVRLTPSGMPLLFDLDADPGEKSDASSAHPKLVEELTRAHSEWFDDMRKTRDFEPPRVKPGTPHEDPMLLTRQDRRGPRPGEPNDANGGWLIELEKEMAFDVTLRFRAPGASVKVTYTGGRAPNEVEVDAQATMVVLKGVPHPAGPGRIGAAVLAAKPYGVDYVELKRAD